MNIAELVFAALTSGSDGLRAHQNKLPRKGDDNYVLPMLVINVISGRHERHLRGDSELRRIVIQLDAWAASRKFADDYMEQALAKMDSATTFKVGAVDESGAPQYDDEANLFRASKDLAIWFNPS